MSCTMQNGKNLATESCTSSAARNGNETRNRWATECNAPLEAQPSSIVELLLRWWKGKDPSEEYLAGATDHADLERRMRLLDRWNGGPVFVTFNH